MAEQSEVTDITDILPSGAESIGFGSVEVAAMLDAGKTHNAIMLRYWNKRVADTVNLTDVSESGSNRTLSVLHRNAVEQANVYRSLVQKEEAEDGDGGTDTATRGVVYRTAVRG